MDRIDLCVEVPRVPYEHFIAPPSSETSQMVQERVCAARAIQQERFASSERITNAEMRNSDIDHYCVLPSDAQDILGRAVHQMSLSARSYYRVIKIARTIADLDAVEHISVRHIAESLQYRHKPLI